MKTAGIGERVASLPWPELQADLDRCGFAQTPAVLSAGECRELAASYETGSFRSAVTMARHGFGSGEYKYFDDPLPEVVSSLRSAFYPPLAVTANRWAERLGEEVRYPGELAAFLERCHEAGQRRPTPLILRYGAGDWNALHQDIYGEVAFPLQIVALLDRPGVDFEGGEFVLAEQRPRAQPGPRPAAPPGRLPDLRHPPAAGRGEARLLPGGDAPRSEHADAGAADNARRDLPRRPLTGLTSGGRRPSSGIQDNEPWEPR